MARTYLVEDRQAYRCDPEWSTSQIAKFPSFSKARAYAKKLPLGGWIDTKEGNKIVSTHNISARKAKKARKARKARKAS